jgi:hypothetical protein
MGVVESGHRIFVRRLESEVDFPVGSQAGPIRDPERRFAVSAVADALPKSICREKAFA